MADRMVTIRYRTRRGGSAIERIPYADMADRLAALCRRGFEAEAEDEQGPCGWVWRNDGVLTWCCEVEDGTFAPEARP